MLRVRVTGLEADTAYFIRTITTPKPSGTPEPRSYPPGGYLKKRDAPDEARVKPDFTLRDLRELPLLLQRLH